MSTEQTSYVQTSSEPSALAALAVTANSLSGPRDVAGGGFCAPVDQFAPASMPDAKACQDLFGYLTDQMGSSDGTAASPGAEGNPEGLVVQDGKVVQTTTVDEPRLGHSEAVEPLLKLAGPGSQSAVDYASSMVGVIEASTADGVDPTNRRPFRKGHAQLLDIFRLAFGKPGSGRYFDDDVQYLDGHLKAWCGIFALWALKSAGVSVGTWVESLGIGSVSGMRLLRPNEALQAGDVGYIDNGWQHHVLVASASGGQVQIIEGNADNKGAVIGPHPVSRADLVGVYRAKQLDETD